MRIRITVPLFELGPIQWTRGQEVDVPEELARQLEELGKVVILPIAETATMPAPERAVLPRPTGKPKPPSGAKKRS